MDTALYWRFQADTVDSQHYSAYVVSAKAFHEQLLLNRESKLSLLFTTIMKANNPNLEELLQNANEAKKEYDDITKTRDEYQVNITKSRDPVESFMEERLKKLIVKILKEEEPESPISKEGQNQAYEKFKLMEQKYHEYQSKVHECHMRYIRSLDLLLDGLITSIKKLTTKNNPSNQESELLNKVKLKAVIMQLVSVQTGNKKPNPT